jgi:hypothetical protein
VALAPLKMLATKWHMAFSAALLGGFVIQQLMIM